jgi:hypothetical protein
VRRSYTPRKARENIWKARVAQTKKELDAQFRTLTEKHDALAETVRRLAAHTAVLAVALRDPLAVPPADLDAALTSINDLSRFVTRPPTS